MAAFVIRAHYICLPSSCFFAVMRPGLRGIFLLVFTLMCRPGHGQALVPGYVVTTELDSLRGAICPRDEFEQQLGVDFVLLNGTQRRWLDARQVKAYGYVQRGDTVRYVAVVLNQDPAHGGARGIFLRQLVAGPVELYEYHYIPLPPPGGIIVRGGQPLLFPALSVRSARFGSGRSLVLYHPVRNTTTEVTWWNFPAAAAAYFADSPALAADLQAKHYRPRAIPQVVKRYNAWCAAAAFLDGGPKASKSPTASIGINQSMLLEGQHVLEQPERP